MSKVHSALRCCLQRPMGKGIGLVAGYPSREDPALQLYDFNSCCNCSCWYEAAWHSCRWFLFFLSSEGNGDTGQVVGATALDTGRSVNRSHRCKPHSLSLSHTHTHSLTHLLTLSLSLIHTHTHTLSLSLTHTLSLSLTHTLTRSLSLTHTLSLSHSLTHTHTLSLSLTHTLSLSHTHTLSLSLTYTHTLSLSLSLSLFSHTHTHTHSTSEYWHWLFRILISKFGGRLVCT